MCATSVVPEPTATPLIWQVVELRIWPQCASLLPCCSSSCKPSSKQHGQMLQFIIKSFLVTFVRRDVSWDEMWVEMRWDETWELYDKLKVDSDDWLMIMLWCKLKPAVKWLWWGAIYESYSLHGMTSFSTALITDNVFLYLWAQPQPDNIHALWKLLDWAQGSIVCAYRKPWCGRA